MDQLQRRVLPAVFLVCACWAVSTSHACAAPPFTLVATGFDLQQSARPALADDGTVVAAEPEGLVLGDGVTVSFIDLAPSGLMFSPSNKSVRPVQVRSAGDIVFAADRFAATGCAPYGARGVYRTDTGGSPPATLFEECIEGPSVGEKVGPHVSMSPNGTVAFSSIVSSEGAIHRGPVAGPVSLLRSGSGTFYNTGEIGVNDSGQVAVQMEYGDPFGGLKRGILIFELVEQALTEIDTALERVTIQPSIAINSAGKVAFSSNFDFSMDIDGTLYSYTKGVYVSDPTLFNTEKMLTQIADAAGGYCGFGRVDINDVGTVVFEAQLVGGLSACTPDPNAIYDGIFMGSDPVNDRIATFNDAALEAHRYFDEIRLGEINNSDQVSFLTTYSEPLVEPTYIWRAELSEVRNERFIEGLIRRWRNLIRRLLERWGLFP